MAVICNALYTQNVCALLIQQLARIMRIMALMSTFPEVFSLLCSGGVYNTFSPRKIDAAPQRREVYGSMKLSRLIMRHSCYAAQTGFILQHIFFAFDFVGKVGSQS